MNLKCATFLLTIVTISCSDPRLMTVPSFIFNYNHAIIVSISPPVFIIYSYMTFPCHVALPAKHIITVNRAIPRETNN